MPKKQISKFNPESPFEPVPPSEIVRLVLKDLNIIIQKVYYATNSVDFAQTPEVGESNVQKSLTAAQKELKDAMDMLNVNIVLMSFLDKMNY